MKNAIEVLGREQYKFEYGHYPRGNGAWAFEIEGMKNSTFGNSDTFHANGLYADAVKQAKEYAREIGARWIRVLT